MCLNCRLKWLNSTLFLRSRFNVKEGVEIGEAKKQEVIVKNALLKGFPYDALKEIHEIREQIYEETKNMTPQERAAHAHNEAQKLILTYHLKTRSEEKPAWKCQVPTPHSHQATAPRQGA